MSIMASPFSLEEDMKYSIAIIVALLSISVYPAQAIDFTKPITQIDGSPIADKDGKILEKQPTLGTICISALLAEYADEASGPKMITPEDKFNRWKLALKLADNKDPKNVTLTSEELALVKNVVGKAYGPVVVGQAWTELVAK
jgi:hypothetical protein